MLLSNTFPLREVNALLEEGYEICESEAQNPSPVAAVFSFIYKEIIIKKYGNFEHWDSINWNFLQHSEELYNK